MKVLVTGAHGQLGHDVIDRLEKCGIEHKGVGSKDFDITDKQKTIEVICAYHPDTVIHCAAYTAVDKAESEKELCYTVNVDGTRNVAEACRHIDAKMLYISTDYVFDGKGDKPFEVDSTKAPLSHYGLTKSLGEDAVMAVLSKYFIVRISWVFGVNGSNFVKTMMRLGKEKEELRIVDDQIGSPTYTFDLAKLLSDIVQTDKYGVYHATNEGYCSWCEFAQAIIKETVVSCEIKSITSEEYPTVAERPLNSRMSKKSLDESGFERLPGWEEALSDFINGRQL